MNQNMNEITLKKPEDDKLFAMAAYKSVYLKDFELLRDGESNLNKLCNARRKLVDDNIQEIQTRITTEAGNNQSLHDALIARINFLNTADLSILIKQSDFLVDYDGSPHSLESVAKKLLGDGLAFELVRDGYLDENVIKVFSQEVSF